MAAAALDTEAARIAVSWRLALSGTAGRLSGLTTHTTVGQLASLLGMGPICVTLRGDNGVVYRGHAERPFLGIASGAPESVDCDEKEVGADIVAVTDGWSNPTKMLRWKDVRLSEDEFRDHGLLRALIAVEVADDVDGVRTKTRVRAEISYVVDGRYVFVRLLRDYDVWLAYWGNLTVDGAALEPRSVWLHADLHTALQPVEVGRNFTLPLVAAQYTEVHLRFELDPLPLTGRPLRVAFDAAVGMVRLEPRRLLSGTDHVSAEGVVGWALVDGAVAWSSSAPCFLDACISVFEDGPFPMPAPHTYEYAVAPGGSNDVEFDAGFDRADGSPWHRSRNPYCGLAVVRKRPAQPRDFEPWYFVLRARRML